MPFFPLCLITSRSLKGACPFPGTRPQPSPSDLAVTGHLHGVPVCSRTEVSPLALSWACVPLASSAGSCAIVGPTREPVAWLGTLVTFLQCCGHGEALYECLPVPVLQLREHRGGLVVDEAPASRPPGLPASALSGSLLPAVPPPRALGVLSPGGGCRGPTLGP